MFIVGNYRFEAFILQERRLAQASSKRVQMMRRTFRREVTESNAKNMSHVRHLVWGFEWQQRANPLRQSSLCVKGQLTNTLNRDFPFDKDEGRNAPECQHDGKG